MNVFEYLEVPAHLHRTEKKVVQLVKNYDEVNPKTEQGIYHKNSSFPLWGQVKKDGVFCMLVVEEGLCAMFNRTGRRMTNTKGLEDMYKMYAIHDKLPDGVYLGELCNPNVSLEVLSGCVNPNRTKPLDLDQVLVVNKMVIHFFDYLQVDEFIKGKSDSKYSTRWAMLHCCLQDLNWEDSLGPEIIMITNEQELRAFAQKHIDAGEEGAVFKQDVGWLAGAKDWHQMKLVRGIHVDLECIGYEEGTGKYEGKVSNLLFRYKDGKTVKAMLGKGWTHDDAAYLFNCVTKPNHPCTPIGQIYHVYGLQPSSKNGLIRLPKVGELRHDKTEPDF